MSVGFMTTLRLAIQKSGRLSDGSRKLIAESGIEVEQIGARLRSAAYNFPLELLYLRDDDIPEYVADGVVDAAIVGLNVVREQEGEVRVIRELGFGRCRLSIAVPKAFSYQGPQSLQGLRIATSYPHILGSYLTSRGISAQMHEITGSVEIAPTIGLGDAVCDLVSSGSTLMSNGLVEVETVLQSQAVLIASPTLSSEKEDILGKLLFRVNAVLRARNTKYITLNTRTESIPEIVKLLPGMKSPSVLPLTLEGWSSLHTVVSEDDFWGVVEKLKQAGAEGLLVLPIEKVIA
jgi:ATP phosphoribosyltransferase